MALSSSSSSTTKSAKSAPPAKTSRSFKPKARPKFITAKKAAPKPRFRPSQAMISGHRDELVEFLETDLSGLLEDVPGVDDQIAECAAEAGVDNSFALVGKFLSLRKANADARDEMRRCCGRFVDFLAEEFGVEDEPLLNVITVAVGMKANYGVAGAFDAALFDLGLVE
ncbi:unnamed protein product [Phytophthora fragariaefolia]|uniref:Unnamed protein product n=1 Tax=Phytophthora fragariaefolia TaxID=1490495 RepID=A0A9W7CXM8_9STRA|nr:unnamed protein product [Phytophthora fragariaefolia]